jgi:hypothetical protein
VGIALVLLLGYSVFMCTAAVVESRRSKGSNQRPEPVRTMVDAR